MSMAELLFELPSIEGWETRLQVTYIAPPEPPDPNLPPDVVLEATPRRNIVVSRTLATDKDAAAAWSTFLSQTARAVPDLNVVTPPEDITFDDGVSGVIAQISFPALASVRLRRFHAFRIDGPLLTQLVATVDEAGDPSKSEELRQKLFKFAPHRGG